MNLIRKKISLICGTGDKAMNDDLISRQAAIDAADNMVEPQESEG